MAYQGRDKRVGFWSLCVYFIFLILASKHWCCGVLAPPPCQLSNCTWDWDPRTDDSSPGWSVLTRTPFLHSAPPGSPRQVFAHMSLSQGESQGHPIHNYFQDTSQIIQISPHTNDCHPSHQVFDVIVSHMSLIEHMLPWDRDMFIALSPVSRQ